MKSISSFHLIENMEQKCGHGGNHGNLCRNEECKFCYSRSFASSNKSKNWSKRNKEKPRDVLKGTSKKYWLECDVCCHCFLVALYHVSENRWCSFCSNKILCEDSKCEVCYTKSFASSDEAQFWSKKNCQTPRKVFKNSHKKFWFGCQECNHEFISSPHALSNGHKCRYCGSKELCSGEECKFCFEKSFASSERVMNWSKKNKLTPRHVFKNSHKKFWFDCFECRHEFETGLDVITGGHWCRYCSHEKLCDNMNCEWCKINSFESCDKSNFWSKKNNLIPRQVSRTCHTKFLFDCQICANEFSATPHNISIGEWCPFCKRKTEKKLFKILLSQFPDTTYGRTFEWCFNETTGRRYIFDFFVPSLNVIVELDGMQHFIQVMNWKSPDDNHITDLRKMEIVLEHGISIIRLYQPEVYRDNWNFTKFLEVLTKKREVPTKEFVSDEGVYDSW
jgi:Probable Zinc-ribbon domain